MNVYKLIPSAEVNMSKVMEGVEGQGRIKKLHATT